MNDRGELNEREQLAALEGWATNRGVPLVERLEAAMQVIAGLRKILDEVETKHCPCDRPGCVAI